MNGQPIEPSDGSDAIIVLNEVGSTLVYASSTSPTAKIINRELVIKTDSTVNIRFTTSSGATVKIYIYDPSNNILVNGDTMTEVISETYSYSYTIPPTEGDYLVRCVDETNNLQDAISLTALLPNNWYSTHSEIELIKQVETGRWKIENNQLIFYKDDNVTELMRFNLLDKSGQPTETNVFERVRV